MSTELDVELVGAERAAEVLQVIHRAFATRPALDPPATAGDETLETVAATLERDGGLLATRRGLPMGAILFDRSRPGMLGLKRVSVDPLGRDRGVASVMVGVAEDVAEEGEMDGIWLHVREELPDNIRFWSHRHYLPVRQDGRTIEMGKTLWLAREVPDADAMRDLAARVATLLRAGDLLVLTGDLGAGKTTFTQGLGEALGVRGPVTSPTFVIARTHPSEVGGPALVHVDAYRLGSAAEIDDIDLDATTDESVTVVEWGAGMAEQLSDSWLSVAIEARLASPGDPLGTASGVESDEMRVVTIRPRGRRWLEVPLRSTLLG
ncbi:tRNA (adenosine(37)-N6)-threonylcarbamoyltransferase complex ATPase subunit type 1 TsaE [Aeromicrobium senzhongii]|nr:tRNA (adenosine(37)-N6)-threonylcarbamoyltransferase complex ATPase subunit type 1 TsaE [Aeromicrobium senzhongii]